uniref:Uncharacterized protein n=1 Tax=Oryza sativa subsp. japonica TaxID=39947 RepID=Q6K421_ORYSJ|nr:hypothetical protein [Oryza sativa Japonica Group]
MENTQQNEEEYALVISQVCVWLPEPTRGKRGREKEVCVSAVPHVIFHLGTQSKDK